ncbi:MAG: ABC transporter ATP-binding protein [Spirochaetota bacterium]|nr:ABC transporter ATP-binding protein [Spirochaetota bacterium]
MIVCENLVKIYTQTGVDVIALQGLDLNVEQGEMIGIVGESGSGKSTLLNVVGGLDRPTAGNVSVAGQDLLKMREKDLDGYRCTQVGFVWQQTTRNLTPYLSARENVELPMRLTSRTAPERQTRALELLDMVGLAERAHHLPGQLSGGEQQRVAIALGLANQPGLLLADEPTGELDTMTSLSIYDLFKSVNRAFGTTIVIVSHDPNIWRHVDRVVAIRDGKTSTETTRIVENDPAQSKEYTEHTEALLMVDTAGRVQIPKLALEQSRIGSRVRVEVQGDSVTLYAVEGYRRVVEDADSEDEIPVLMEEDPLPEDGRSGWKDKIKAWIRRIKR